MLSDVILILSLIVANGLFAATEIAVISLRKTRLNQLIEHRRRGALAVRRLRERPEWFLATVQVGITALGAAAAAYGEDSLGEQTELWLATVPAVAEWAEIIAFALTIVGITFLSVVLGELVPKSLALRAPELVALSFGRPLLWLSAVTRPAVWLLTGSSNLILRLFRDKTSFTESRLSPDELQELVEEAARSGELDGGTADIASRALELRELETDDVMRPRTQLLALSAEASLEELRIRLGAELPDRVLLYEGSIDTVVGYVAIKDLVGLVLQGQPFTLRERMRPAMFVPGSVPAVSLLLRMRAERIPLAVVIDESGGTRGAVELQDLFEELVGDLQEGSLSGHPDVVREPDGTLTVPGTIPVRELNREYELGLPEGDDWSTIAGLCLELAGAIPVQGTLLRTADGTELEVTASDAKAVRRVRVRKDPKPRSPSARSG